MGKLPVDKGWAWLTVLGAAWCMFAVVASFKSQGLLFVEFIEKFEASSYLTAWMMGVSACGMSLFSPAATYLAKHYSCRVVVFTGSCLCASAAFLASFATNIYFVICVYGGITGLGYAFMYGPGLMLIGVYFDKRRTLANGLALSGASVGQLIIPLLMRHLIKHYGVFGALRIYSAFLLHGLVAALLMRPPEYYSQTDSGSQESEEYLSKNITSSKSHVTQPPLISNSSTLNELNATKLTALDYSVTSRTETTSCRDIVTTVKTDDDQNSCANPPCSDAQSPETVDLDINNETVLSVQLESSATGPDDSELKGSVEDAENINKQGFQGITKGSSVISHESRSGNLKHIQEYSSQVCTNPKDDLSSFKDLTKESHDRTDASAHVSCCNDVQETQMEDLSRSSKTEMLSGALQNNTEQNLDIIEKGDHDKKHIFNATILAAQSSKHGCRQIWCVQTCFKLYRWDHLTNTLFLIYVGSCAIGNSAYVDHSMLIPPYAKSIGINKDTAAWLLATVGIGDFIGRIFGGWFADLKILKRSVQMSSAMMLIGGTTLVCTCFPSLWSLCVLCIVLGLVGGAYVSMYTVVLIDFLGLPLFPSAFGLMIMFQGLFNTVLPSILGLLKDLTDTYQSSLILLGVLMVFSGSLLLWEPCARKHEQKKMEERQ